jgi:hypothetical protein
MPPPLFILQFKIRIEIQIRFLHQSMDALTQLKGHKFYFFE